MNTTTVWYCDTCQEPILEAKRGMVVWEVRRDLSLANFEIVHQGKQCDTHRDWSSWHLNEAIGPDGQESLLSFLSDGKFRGNNSRNRIADMDQFVDLFRRLQTPGYEEARRYLGSPSVVDAFSDSHEYAPYTPHGISRVIELGRKDADES